MSKKVNCLVCILLFLTSISFCENTEYIELDDYEEDSKVINARMESLKEKIQQNSEEIYKFEDLEDEVRTEFRALQNIYEGRINTLVGIYSGLLLLLIGIAVGLPIYRSNNLERDIKLTHKRLVEIQNGADMQAKIVEKEMWINRVLLPRESSLEDRKTVYVKFLKYIEENIEEIELSYFEEALFMVFEFLVNNTHWKSRPLSRIEPENAEYLFELISSLELKESQKQIYYLGLSKYYVNKNINFDKAITNYEIGKSLGLSNPAYLLNSFDTNYIKNNPEVITRLLKDLKSNKPSYQAFMLIKGNEVKYNKYT